MVSFSQLICVLTFKPDDISLRCRCGSGLSGEALTEAGHCWVGIDISRHMLGGGTFSLCDPCNTNASLVYSGTSLIRTP